MEAIKPSCDGQKTSDQHKGDSPGKAVKCEDEMQGLNARQCTIKHATFSLARREAAHYVAAVSCAQMPEMLQQPLQCKSLQ